MRSGNGTTVGNSCGSANSEPDDSDDADFCADDSDDAAASPVAAGASGAHHADTGAHILSAKQAKCVMRGAKLFGRWQYQFIFLWPHILPKKMLPCRKVQCLRDVQVRRVYLLDVLLQRRLAQRLRRR